MGDLDTYYQRIKNVQTDPPRVENPWATLKEFCESNSVAIEPHDCLRAINKVYHARALRSAWRLLIRDMGPDSKCRKIKVLWMGGKASSGKSLFIRRLRSIFSGDEVTWRGEYLPTRYANRPDLKP